MIDRQFAVKQICRLSALNYFPQFKEGVNELVRALEASTSSESHAEQTVDVLVDRFDNCPKPSDIRRVAAENTKAAQAHVGCSLCGGTGYLIEYRGKSSFARRCKCMPAVVA